MLVALEGTGDGVSGGLVLLGSCGLWPKTFPPGCLLCVPASMGVPSTQGRVSTCPAEM